MKGKFAIIWIAAVFGPAGCFESASLIGTGSARRIDTPAGMVEHLQSENLPALKSVEVWENDYGPGLKLTTAHYEVFTTLLEPLMLRQIPGFVESAYWDYQAQLPEPVGTTIRFTIYLFATREQWEDFTRSFAGARAWQYSKIKNGAYYLNGACVAYNIGIERTFSVLGHEGWHQFNNRHFTFRLPSWLDEGIATLFEVHRSEKGLFYFEPGRNAYRLGALKKTLINSKMIPLRELIAVNPGELLAADQTDAMNAFYGQSYALVRFLREEGYGKRLRNYHQLLLGGLGGDWPLSTANKRMAADRNIPRTVKWNRSVGPLLFKHYIDDDIDQIEKEYIAFCRKMVYQVKLKGRN
ncbi:MAG: hypothetical protein FVQ85_10900 [Planctomycetes bacterium]|nr:hypothetical protein [Planctomycetota bacterium]